MAFWMGKADDGVVTNSTEWKGTAEAPDDRLTARATWNDDDLAMALLGAIEPPDDDDLALRLLGQ